MAFKCQPISKALPIISWGAVDLTQSQQNLRYAPVHLKSLVMFYCFLNIRFMQYLIQWTHEDCLKTTAFYTVEILPKHISHTQPHDTDKSPVTWFNSLNKHYCSEMRSNSKFENGFISKIWITLLNKNFLSDNWYEQIDGIISNYVLFYSKFRW